MSLRSVDAMEFRSPPPPIPWIIEGLVAQHALTVMAGVGGLGKSLLGLGLASASDQGATFYAGLPVRRSLPMVYVDAENGRHEMHRRAHYFNQYDGFYEFEGNLDESLTELADVLGQGDRPAFVVLDSFRALYPYAEEDQSKDVLPILRQLQVLARVSGSGILLLHHTTKGGNTYRGSGEFQNRPEITVVMAQDARGERYLNWEKCRMGVEPDRRYLRIVEVDGRLSWREGKEFLTADHDAVRHFV